MPVTLKPSTSKPSGQRVDKLQKVSSFVRRSILPAYRLIKRGALKRAICLLRSTPGSPRALKRRTFVEPVLCWQSWAHDPQYPERNRRTISNSYRPPAELTESIRRGGRSSCLMCPEQIG